MCGIAAAFNEQGNAPDLHRASHALRHRGPDAAGDFVSSSGVASLAHRRLSIIDLSDAGTQPMASADGRYRLVFNGEIYNYRELRSALAEHIFTSATDSEVLLAAFMKWGDACLERLNGMFAFVVWDDLKQTAFAARDRFGVKPLYFARAADGSVLVASEISALHAMGVPRTPDDASWAAYLAHGRYEEGGRTFWEGVCSVPAGHLMRWRGGRLEVTHWYDLATCVREAGVDERREEFVAEEYLALMLESVELRFRSDVPVGVNVSGGVDSSALLGVIHALQGADSSVSAFTFITGDPNYDELPWVNQLLDRTRHRSVVCHLPASDVPALASAVALTQDGPFGGIPTLAYARLFERARDEGVTVLLDGQGMDEQWAGYDYYQAATAGVEVGVVQGATRPLAADALDPEFAALAPTTPPIVRVGDALTSAQHRDLTRTKIPRALRFNDRVSMRMGRELREPFLDHRLVELALRQPTHRKIADGIGKVFLRRVVADRLPGQIVDAPKRPLQTPQREWLRGPLRSWTEELVNVALQEYGSSWLQPDVVRPRLERFMEGEGDNSFYVWQWLNLGLNISMHAPELATTP